MICRIITLHSFILQLLNTQICKLKITFGNNCQRRNLFFTFHWINWRWFCTLAMQHVMLKRWRPNNIFTIFSWWDYEYICSGAWSLVTTRVACLLRVAGVNWVVECVGVSINDTHSPRWRTNKKRGNLKYLKYNILQNIQIFCRQWAFLKHPRLSPYSTRPSVEIYPEWVVSTAWETRRPGDDAGLVGIKNIFRGQD